MIFPYIEFRGFVEERIFRPMIPVTFEFGGKSVTTYALVDSGADYTILPIEIAGRLNLKLEGQINFEILGAGENSFRVYKSPENIKHIIKKRGFRDITCMAEVYFAESGVTTLLGQKGFLSSLDVNLRGKKRELEIKV